MIYAGIGSRGVPDWIADQLEHLGEWMAKHGHTLRSGHAEGCDQAFERGCVKAGGKMEIYLPWQNFNDSNSKLIYRRYDGASDVARKFHPAFDALAIGAKMLHSRNSYQILGYDLEALCDCVICYTKQGKGDGGTGQALRIAKFYSVPIFDFGKYNSRSEMRDAFNKFYKETIDGITGKV